MNNSDKITAQELIISTAQAEIKELKSQKVKRFKPDIGDVYWAVDVDFDGGAACHIWDGDIVDLEIWKHFNCYETEALATKASPMMKRNNAIIMACLTVDPDFVPDYLSGDQEHFAFHYQSGEMGMFPRWVMMRDHTCSSGPCVSTGAKWKEAAALLTEWGIE